MDRYQAFTFTGQDHWPAAALEGAAGDYAAWLNAQQGDGHNPAIYNHADGLPTVMPLAPVITYTPQEPAGVWVATLVVLAAMRLPPRPVQDAPA